MNRIRKAAEAVRRRVRALLAQEGRTVCRGPVSGSEAGTAIVEFLGISLILLIPLTYLVLILGRLQAATFAVESAAKDAARAFTLAKVDTDAEVRALTAIDIALSDQGFEMGESEFTIDCEDRDCHAAGSAVSARVMVRVALPGVPASIGSDVPLQIPVTAEHMTVIDPLRAMP